jgi:hypothetical protein
MFIHVLCAEEDGGNHASPHPRAAARGGDDEGLTATHYLIHALL